MNVSEVRKHSFPREGHLLVYNLLENEKLESNVSVGFQSYPGYAFLLQKTIEGQFQKFYQAESPSESGKETFQFRYSR